MKRYGELGRSTLEVILVLSLGVLLVIGGLHLWRSAEIKNKAQVFIHRVVAMKVSRQAAMATNFKKALIRAEIGPYNIMISIRNGTIHDNNKDFYWITIISSDSTFRSAIEKEGRLRLDPCLVRNSDVDITFYFPKFPKMYETNKQLNEKIVKGDIPAPDKGLEANLSTGIALSPN